MTGHPMIGELLRRASSTPPDLLAADIAAALASVGGTHLVLYVVDYEQETLQAVALAADLMDDAPKGVVIEGTMAGRTFRSQQVLSAETAAGWRVWAPVRERAERIGVLELGFPAVDDDVLDLADQLGLLAGHLVHTAGRYTDLIELRRRRRPMNLAAEMQWDLLPPLAFGSPDLAIAGVLEPAYFVAGDAFDYSLNGDLLGFAIIDAMGHGVGSTLASTLALGAFRYGRRRALDLPMIAENMDEAVESEFHGESFVTGHVASLDVGTGTMRWVNAGHPPPLLIRGARVVSELSSDPCLPLGLGIDVTEVASFPLQPEDGVLFYSDGAIEARPSRGVQFGLDRLRHHLEEYMGAGMLPAEILRRLTLDLRDHRGGELDDDATLVLVEWQPRRPVR